MKKRFFSIVLAVLMVVGMIPMAVFTASAECPHTDLEYSDNRNGTHDVFCFDCHEWIAVEAGHNFENGECICGAIECLHPADKYEYRDEGGHSGHVIYCGDCGAELERVSECTFNNGVCIYCGYVCDHDGRNYGTCYEIPNNHEVHRVQCAWCDVTWTAPHNFVNGYCKKCGADEPVACQHTNKSYVDNGDGTHNYVCNDCSEALIENEEHVFYGPTCDCGAVCQHPTATYTDLGNGKHHVRCTACCYDNSEDHVFVNGKCICGAREPVACQHNHVSVQIEAYPSILHTLFCNDCHTYIADCETHKCVDGVCICGYTYGDLPIMDGCTHPDDYVFIVNKGVYHEIYCGDCVYEFPMPHNFVNGVCEVCGATGSGYTYEFRTCPRPSMGYADNGDGETHNKVCTECREAVEWYLPNTMVNGVCAQCGYTEQPVAPELKITHSLVMADKIGTKVYVNMDEVSADKVVFNYNTDNTGYSKTFADVTVAKSAMTDEGNGRYSYTIWQTPAQIAEDITIKVLDGADAQIGETKTVNGKSYADAVMAGSYSDALKGVCEAMVLYAYECQQTFSGSYTTTAIDLTGYDASKLNGVSFDSAKAVQVVSGDKSKLQGVTFMALSGSAVRVYAKKDSTVTATESGTNGDFMYAQISGISAVDFDTMQTLTMTVDGEEITLSICPLSYAVAAKNDIAKSMVLYSTATDAYVASL